MAISILTILSIIILNIHALYQLFFLIGLTRIKSKQPSKNNSGVSVIVAARNEFQNLQELVPAVLNQSYSDFELIIVNDRSDDESNDYLIELDKNPKVNVVFVDHLPDHVNSKKYALTLGIKAAKNDLLLLTDADCVPSSSKWIENMVSSYDGSTRIVLGFSPYSKESGLINALIRFETHLTGILFLAAASNKKPYMGVGRNLLYSKEFFMENKGFNGFINVVGGDDDLFVNKSAKGANTIVKLDPDAITISKPKSTLRSYITQKVRHLSVGKYYRTRDKLFLGLFSLAHIFSWIVLIGSLIFNSYPIIFGIIFFVGFLLLILNFNILNKKSGVRFSLWLVPIMDVVYWFFYIFVGLRTLFTKKVEWTT